MICRTNVHVNILTRYNIKWIVCRHCYGLYRWGLFTVHVYNNNHQYLHWCPMVPRLLWQNGILGPRCIWPVWHNIPCCVWKTGADSNIHIGSGIFLNIFKMGVKIAMTLTWVAGFMGPSDRLSGYWCSIYWYEHICQWSLYMWWTSLTWSDRLSVPVGHWLRQGSEQSSSEKVGTKVRGRCASFLFPWSVPCFCISFLLHYNNALCFFLG